ncbi:uncharacterized protein LOC62_03G005086 [Vanrija pseudolonga]|uniref:RanBP2-type domain-containing protein n=1 Tax=Vanrija pseudolonga TaxID=143232 RepID=A0AAF0YCY4_9TREE|nr:hypothetical protein LOC62_03G005086 [Vanrija pseudolonga]
MDLTPLPPSDSMRRSSSPLSTTMSEATEGSIMSYPTTSAGGKKQQRTGGGDKGDKNMTGNKDNANASDTDTAQQQQQQQSTVGFVLPRIQSLCPDSDEDGDTTDDDELLRASKRELAKILKSKNKGRSAVESYVTSEEEDGDEGKENCNSEDDGDIDIDCESDAFEACSDDDEEMNLDEDEDASDEDLDFNDDEEHSEEDSEMEAECDCGICGHDASSCEDDSERSHDSDEESNLDNELSDDDAPEVRNEGATAGKPTPQPRQTSFLAAISSRGSKSSISSAPTPKVVTPPDVEEWSPVMVYKKPSSSAPRPTAKPSTGGAGGAVSPATAPGPDWRCGVCLGRNSDSDKEMCFICETPRPNAAATPEIGRGEGAPKRGDMTPTTLNITGTKTIALPTFTTPLALPPLDSIELPVFGPRISLNKGTATPKTVTPPTGALATPTNTCTRRPEEDKGNVSGGNVPVKKSAPPSSNASRKGLMVKRVTPTAAAAGRSLLEATLQRHRLRDLFNTHQSTAPAPPTNTQTSARSQPPTTQAQTPSQAQNPTQAHQSTDEDCHCSICLRDKSPDNITIPNLPRLRIFEELTDGIDSHFDDLMHQQIGDGLKRRREVIVKDIDRARAKRMKKEKKANKHISEADAKVQAETEKVEAARAALTEAEKGLEGACNVRHAAVAELNELRNTALVIGEQSAADIIAAHNEQVGKFAAGFGWNETMA